MRAFLLGVLIFITGCTYNNQVSIPQNQNQKSLIIKKVEYNNKTCLIDNRVRKNCVLTIEAKGVGIVPCNGACSMAQAKVMARRSAILDGYRALIEKIYGIKINGIDSVKNMALQSSVIRSHIEGVVRGANIEEESFKDGIYTVVMSVKIDINKWNSFLASIHYPYSYDYVY